MIYTSPNINQMTCTDGHFILRNNGTYDMILKYDTNDGQKVTIKGIVDCSRPQIEIYNDFVSGTIDFIFEKDIDKDNNLFTVRIEDK